MLILVFILGVIVGYLFEKYDRRNNNNHKGGIFMPDDD